MKYNLIIIPLLIFSLLTPLVFAHEATLQNQRIIHIHDRGFDPQKIIIDQQTILIFENIGKNDHWPASNIHPTHDIYPEFDPQKPIKPGESWSFTFDKVGEWRYHDHLYPTLSGTITVKKSEAFTPSSSSNSGEGRSLKDRIKGFFINIRTTFLLAYFRTFPQDLEKHFLPNKSLARIANQRDDRLLTYIVKTIGPEKAIQKLFDESGQGSKFNCHIPSHEIGRITYRVLRGEALEKNITLCHSGYHHGVITAFIADKGTENLVTNLSRICEESKTNFGKLTCYHGSGHGLMAYLDNNLPEAINECQKYDSNFKQNNCYVGVFMENIAAKTGDSMNPHETKWLDEADPNFPCNRLDHDYYIQSACYGIQSEWMERLYHKFKDKWQRVTTTCLNAKEEFVPNCFFGMGQTVAAEQVSNPKGILLVCDQVPKTKDYFDRCLIGAQALIMDYWGPNITNQGEQFCNVLPEGNKDICFRLLDNRLQDLGKPRLVTELQKE